MPRATHALVFVLALVGCGTDIAQTAHRPSETPPFDCRPATDATLPTDPLLGGGDDLSTSPLIGDTYGAGQGPGIAIVARDGFRLYQNDESVAESTASLFPRFVPLTFLPGDNVVSVVVSSPERAPALLVHVDELERPYVSDDGWKVSSAPDGDFRSPGYDASGWENAEDHGSTLATGCEPPGFISGSGAHWIGARGANARTAVFRLALRVAPVGYGSATTGGEGATPVVVQDSGELEAFLMGNAPGILLLPERLLDVRRTGADVVTENACPLPCDDGSGQVTYVALSDTQTCGEPTVPLPRDERHFFVGSNKTLVGLGRGAILRGAWLSAIDVENVIVRNVTFYDVNPSIIEAGDGISIDRSARLWLDHLTFRWIGDGFVDVTTPSSEITLSWLRFDGRSEFACGGRHPRANELADVEATVHHSFYGSVTGRAPLANRALTRLHVFNNLMSDDPDYAIGAACGAQILVEGSYFEGVRFPTAKRDCTDDPALGRISAPEGSNEYENGGPHQSAGADSDEPHDPLSFSVPYEYPLDDAITARFSASERAGAGSRWPLPFALDP